MTPETLKALKALKASIAKWEKNARVRNLDNAKIGAKECPLCRLFADDGCLGCPVRQATGMKRCWGTPWEDACDAKLYSKDVAAFRAAAREEVAFLRSLLPEGEE